MSMKIIQAKEPRWVDKEHVYLDILVDFDGIAGFGEYVPHITASFADTEHGVELYSRAMNGEFGKIAPYVELAVDIADIETEWQRDELNKVELALVAYKDDMQIPEIYSELRTTQDTEAGYYKLLGDRKRLVEYLEQSDFPDCGRPELSELSNTSQAQA